MSDTPRYTWTVHTFVCSVCKRLCRASQEAIDEQRANADCDGMTDAMVAQFDFCLKCCAGIEAPGEKVPECEGQTDTEGTPSCDGDDVRPCLFRVERGDWNEARWCEECRKMATFLGYDVAIMEEGGPVVVGMRGNVVHIPLANEDQEWNEAVERAGCTCDNTHEVNDTVCQWCWAKGRRHWNDPEVAVEDATPEAPEPQADGDQRTAIDLVPWGSNFGGIADSPSYRDAMRDAGRGHLLP